MYGNHENRFFIIGMWWRIAYGFLRIMLGLALIKIVGTSLTDTLTTLMSHELIEDSSDILYVFISNLIGQHPLYISYFVATYFIFWGIIDVVLSYNLIKDKIWAFPVSLVLIASFVIYELFRFSYTHSYILLGVIFVDFILFGLIWDEYNRVKLRLKLKQE